MLPVGKQNAQAIFRQRWQFSVTDPQISSSESSFITLTPPQQQARLRELALLFLKLGTIAFGGPAAHIAMMEREVVQHRRWMSRDKLLDLLSVTNLIPGPNSTELAIHIGYERAGWRGLMVAGTCFILPAMLLVWGLAAAYARYQSLPQVEGLLYGVKPVIVAIVLQVLWKLRKSALKDPPTTAAALLVMGLFFAGGHEILLLLLAGVGVMLARQGWQRLPALLLPLPTFPSLLSEVGSAPLVKAGWLNVFLFFLKVGSVLYGSGYVLIAFLQRDLVEQAQWLTSQQLLDAVAIGQFTPGPVFTTATFIGYLVAGNAGAIAATIGIFLPAFVLVAVVNPWVPRLRQSGWLSSLLDGVNAASWALMAGVTWNLGQTALIDGTTIAIGIISLAVILRFSINSAWLVLGGGIAGALWQTLV